MSRLFPDRNADFIQIQGDKASRKNCSHRLRCMGGQVCKRGDEVSIEGRIIQFESIIHSKLDAACEIGWQSLW